MELGVARQELAGEPVVKPEVLLPELHVIDGEGYDPRKAGVDLSKGMPVCVLGCDPRAKDAKRHTVRSRDELLWMRSLMQREGDCLLLIADSPLAFNIERESGGGSPEEVARSMRLIGIREQLFVEALQDYLIEIREFHLLDAEDEMRLYDRTSRVRHKAKAEELRATWGKPMQKREVYLMSDVLAEDPNFMRLFQKMRLLFASDDRFKELVLECIPNGLRERVAGDSRYVLFQFAVTITTLKYKIGHEAERPLDEGVIKFCKEYGEQLGIDHISQSKYEYPNVGGTSGAVFYRHIGMAQSWDMGLPERENGSLSFFQGEDPRDSDAWWDGYMRLGEEVLPLDSRYFDKIKNCERLSPEDRNYLLEVEIWKVMKEILGEFNKIPWFRDILERSGVLPLLRNRYCAKEGSKKSFFDLPKFNTLPFHSEPREYESGSELAYFIRYLGELFQGHQGPVGMAPNRDWGMYGVRVWEFWNSLYLKLTGRTFGGQDLRVEGVFWGLQKWEQGYPEWCKATYDRNPWELGEIYAKKYSD